MGSLRFLLALSVAGGHTASMFGFSAPWIMPGSRAVQIFYMISGFLMALILNGKYGDTPRGNWIFYTNRAVKIYVPYFAVLAATIAVCLISKSISGNALLLNVWFAEAGNMTFPTWAFALFANIFIVGQEWGYLLVYRAGQILFSLHAFEAPPMASQFTIIVPAWTLSIELMFYIVAPFILRQHVLLIAALAYASYRLRFDGYHVGFYSEATNYRFFPFELSLFLYGAICFRLGKFLLPANPKWSGAIAAMACFFVLAPLKLFQGYQYELYAVIGILLPTLFDFGRRAKWDRSLGDLSYPLYLVHWPVSAIAAAIVGSLQPNSIGTVASYPILMVMIAIAVSVLINRYLVLPLDAWRQARIHAPSNSVMLSPKSGTEGVGCGNERRDPGDFSGSSESG
jgi:peptidoglycan/LPS O-acetylase OafA/YrhL